MALKRLVAAALHPVGDGPRNHPEIRHLKLGQLGYAGSSNEGKGGGMLTGGLLIIGQFRDKPYEGEPPVERGRIHAFDQATGDPVAEIDLDAYPLGTPMTYLHQGRQYLVVSTTSAKGQGELVALALPER